MQLIFTNDKSLHPNKIVSIIDNIEDLTPHQIKEIIEYQESIGNDYHYSNHDITK